MVDVRGSRATHLGGDRQRSRNIVRCTLVFSVALLGSAIAQQATNSPPSPFEADIPGGSHASPDLRVSGPNPDGWLYPITRLNHSLPGWIQFGGQFRDRLESSDGIDYAPTNDVYDLTQLRLGVYIQPARWLELVGVTQDSRVFFNHHVSTAPPYQNIWDIREAYLQFGSPTEGWVDFV